MPLRASADDRGDLRAANVLAAGRDPSQGRAAIEALLARIGEPTTAESRDVAARAHYALAQLAEAAREYPAALAHYRALLRIDPGSYYAQIADVRATALEKQLGALVELAELDRVRLDQARSNDADAVIALGNRALAWKRSSVRDSALLFCAHALYARLSRPEDALRLARDLTQTATDDAIDRPQAFELAYASLVALGRIERDGPALAADPRAPSELRVKLQRTLRRLRLHRVSLAIVAIGGLLAIVGYAIAARRGRLAVSWQALRAPSALAMLLVAPLGGYLIAERWESRQGRAFVLLSFGLLGAHLLVAAMRGAIGDRSRGIRIGAGILAASCVIASAYLSLERADSDGVPMLAEFGL